MDSTKSQSRLEKHASYPVVIQVGIEMELQYLKPTESRFLGCNVKNKYPGEMPELGESRPV